MATETPKKVFYRGAKSLRSKRPSYWSYTPRIAKEYAEVRGGKIYKAYLVPKKVVVPEGRNITDSEENLARHLGVYKKWLGARMRGTTGKVSREILYGAAKKAGIDAIAYSNQVVVLDPKIIHPIKPEPTPKPEPKAKKGETKAKVASGIKQAVKDWASGRAYIDSQGNYHVKAEGSSSGPIAPWNKEAKRRFASPSELHERVTGKPRVTGTAEVDLAQGKRSPRAVVIDNSLLAKRVLPANSAGPWLKRPNRFDVRGIDTPGRGRIVRGVAYADKGKQRLSRKHHRGFKRIKFA